MKTIEDYFEENSIVIKFEDTEPENFIDEHYFKKAMLEYGKEVLKLAAEKATCHHIATWNCQPRGVQPEVSKSSILNLINELK
jgi:hypothetical protein